jgi:hypothetical protein
MRSFSRFATYCIGAIVAVPLGAVIFVYSINRREVQTAQQVMEDASKLRVQTSTFSDVLAFSHKYDGEASGAWHDQPCLESGCIVKVASSKNDFWERHPKLGYVADRISRRGWRFSIMMWVKDGRLTAIEQWFTYLTPRGSSFVITTVNRPDPRLCRNPFYRLHHMFAAYPRPKHFGIWVDPAAIQEREMLRLNLDCVLHVAGCKGVPDMVPAAWRAYEADQRLIDANESKGRNEIAADPECR